jgi:UDP-MurNAc hydroxylase
MKFQVISHGCMLIEHSGKRLLIDPWILGSAYWRSWWHFPESVPLNDDMLSADWIYLTHQHFDHFHYPSLRKFRKNLTVLIPRRPVPSMERALTELGFSNVLSMPPGKTKALDGGFSLTSYQGGWMDDSAIVIQCDGTTLIDLNDCKLEDTILDKIVRRHGPIDFVFRSHSSAQAYPQCYTSPNPEDLTLRKKEDYIRDFINTAQRCQARYAIPFASNVCFLHRETIDKNEDSVDPCMLAAQFMKQKKAGDPEIVVMLPGATWDSKEGFSLVPGDVFNRKAEEIARLAFKYRDTLAAQDELERNKTLCYETFISYMGRFLRSLPWFLRTVYTAKIAYHVTAPQESWWVLDFKTRRVSRMDRKPDDAASITEVTPGLLQDALEKGIVNFIDISKRLKVELRAGGTLDHFMYRELLTIYEQGYFPLWRNLNPRFLGVWFQRREEIWGYIRKTLRGREFLIPRVEPVKQN